MNEQDLCKKRLMDLSRQADRKGIALFSDFLNLDEQNTYHNAIGQFATQTETFGGYDGAERQMVAFLPDALYYEWKYPICCLHILPKNPKFAENLTHRDVLGAVMHLGIERGTCGDIICQKERTTLFCVDSIAPYIAENLTLIRHTPVNVRISDSLLTEPVLQEYEERFEMIASNRLDCIVAKAYRLSRTEASDYIRNEKVFLNGKTVTNGSQSCASGTVVSVRGKGRFRFDTDSSLSKKGKLRIHLMLYR